MLKIESFRSRQTAQGVNALLFVITLLLSLNISWSKDDWKNLTDPYDYLHQSKIPLTDKEFYFPHKAADFDPRPFTVPLFYKFCASNPDIIVPMQRMVLLLSAFFLISAMLFFIGKESAKYVLISGVYLLVSWWNVMGWANLVLSESLSTSLLFLWLASFLFMLRKDGLQWWLLHVMITLLFSFTRDSWPYVLIAFYGGICCLWMWFKLPGAKKYGALLLICAGIFFIEQAGARIGERSKLPVINSIVVRILPNAEYTRWFTEHGMPCSEKLQQNFAGLNVVPEEGQHKLWALYTDSAYQPFLDWSLANGQHTYTRFLLTHPDFVLLRHETPAQLDRIMSHDLFYIDEPRGYCIHLRGLFPFFSARVAGVLCLVLLVIYSQRKKPIMAAPALLAFFIFVNVILSYNADALEVERHLFTTNILVQLTGIWASALLWDSVVWRARVKVRVN